VSGRLWTVEDFLRSEQALTLTCDSSQLVCFQGLLRNSDKNIWIDCWVHSYKLPNRLLLR
jgi:hypothetical protein